MLYNLFYKNKEGMTFNNHSLSRKKIITYLNKKMISEKYVVEYLISTSDIIGRK